MTYLVMECRAGYAVVLDNQGCFQKVPNLGYEVGQQLDSVVILPEETNTVIPFRKRLTSLVAAAACFCMLVIGSHQFLLTAYGTVRLQINPDVLLEMNRLDYVIGIEGMNEDGSRLIAGYRYRGKRLERVSEELADLAVEQGFLRDGGEITLTVDSRHEKWQTDKEAVLPEKISAYLGDKVTVHIVAGGRNQESSTTNGWEDAGDAADDRDDVADDRDDAADDRDDTDDDRDDAADDRDDADDDRDDADDDRADADDDRDDTDDDRDDADDDQDDADDDRDYADNDRGDKKKNRADTDDKQDDTDDDRDDADDGRGDADDDRGDADDDRDDADDDRDDTDDDRDNADNHRDDAHNDRDDADDDHGDSGNDNNDDDSNDNDENDD